MSGGDPGYRLENELSHEVVLRTAPHYRHKRSAESVQDQQDGFAIPGTQENHKCFFCHISLRYFSVSVIKCSDEGILKEKGFGLLYSSWRIRSTMVE